MKSTRNIVAVTSDQMYEIEKNGEMLFGMKRLLMMENAGHVTANFILRKFNESFKDKKVVAVCGVGNNAGDAFVACRHLAAVGFVNITVLLLGRPKEIRTREAKINWSIIQRIPSVNKVTLGSLLGFPKEKMEVVIGDADIILDGLFGTGVKGKIKEPYSTAIDTINRSRAFILAIDIPSGLDPNSGKHVNKCVKASATITFHRQKKGLRFARKFTGNVHIESIGIPLESENGVLA